MEKRYIDANELLDKVMLSKRNNNHKSFSIKMNHDFEHEMFGRMVSMMPSEDVAPVAHGRWEEADDGDGAICSVCREDFCNIYLEVDRFKYCPNCGARMDGE